MCKPELLRMTCGVRRIQAAEGRHWARTGLWALAIPVAAALALPDPAAASGVGYPRISSVTVQDNTYTFPTTSVGQTSGACFGVCLCSDVNNCICDESGSINLTHDVSAPFNALNYRVQDAGNSDDCSGGFSVTFPVFLNAGQKLSYAIEFSPTSPGTFSDYLGLNNYTLSVSGSTPSGEASLVPFPLAGWSAPIVVSTTPGTQTDSSHLTSTEPLYLNWALQNQGDLSAFGPFYIDVDLDGSNLQRWIWSNALVPQQYLFVKDYKFGPLAPGTHTLDLVPDPTGVSGASTSTYRKTITITAGVPPPPTMTTSWYVDATGMKPAALSVWANKVGVQAGQLNEVKGDANFLILYFGQPWIMKGVYGATGFPPNFTFVGIPEIELIVKHFIAGYELGTARSLFLGVGTNNYGAFVTAAHGAAWAKMLGDLNAWATQSGFDVTFFAANDVELESSKTPKATVNWFNGFENATGATGTSIPTVNFGDASACPQTTATSTPQKCPGTGWTQADIANLATFQVPEIYNNSTALEWANIDLYNDLANGVAGSLIVAPLSQNQACMQRPHGCGQTDNTAAAAWRQMARALNMSPVTAPGVSGMAWSTDIKWNQ